MYVYMYVCMYDVCMYVCACSRGETFRVKTTTGMNRQVASRSLFHQAYKDLCVHIRVVCMYVCTYGGIRTHTHTHAYILTSMQAGAGPKLYSPEPSRSLWINNLTDTHRNYLFGSSRREALCSCAWRHDVSASAASSAPAAATGASEGGEHDDHDDDVVDGQDGGSDDDGRHDDEITTMVTRAPMKKRS